MLECLNGSEASAIACKAIDVKAFAANHLNFLTPCRAQLIAHTQKRLTHTHTPTLRSFTHCGSISMLRVNALWISARARVRVTLSYVALRYDWPSFQLFTGNLVQRHHAIGHHRAAHHGESRLTSHADYTQSASAGLWQLFLRGRESAWQVTQNSAAERKTECCRF